MPFEDRLEAAAAEPARPPRDLRDTSRGVRSRQVGMLQNDGRGLTRQGAAALQRLAGNRAVVSALSARRGAAGPTLQRSMYLHNEDDLIYKDSDRPDSEYAYITKGATPFFIPYPGVAAIQRDPFLVSLRATQSPRAFNSYVDDLAAMAAAGRGVAGVAGDPRATLTALGSVHSIDTTGKVTQVAVDLSSFTHQMIISKLVRDAFMQGAAYLNTGGGSRLPRAAGHLIYNREYDLAVVQARLGLTDDMLGNVTPHPAPPGMVAAAVADLRSSGFVVFTASLGSGDGPDAVYGSSVTAPRSASSRVTCRGKSYADDLSDAAGDLPQLHQSFNAMTAPQSTGWVPGTTLTTVPRGDGQMAARGKWNALGAAAYAKAHLGLNVGLEKNWEWLHLQGAQIGGATVAGNLVPGLFVTNSLMIPYETMIARWAAAGPTTFWAKFEAVGVHSTVFASRIRLSITAQGHPQLGTLRAEPLIEVDPLAGSVVDKVANELIKREIDRNVRA